MGQRASCSQDGPAKPAEPNPELAHRFYCLAWLPELLKMEIGLAEI